MLLSWDPRTYSPASCDSPYPGIDGDRKHRPSKSSTEPLRRSCSHDKRASKVVPKSTHHDLLCHEVETDKAGPFRRRQD